jgi:tRNA(Ile)-lysidine synthase
VRDGAARPIDVQTFAAALGALGPFEPEAVLAVAVSGGSDSMALALLADRWARARGGRIVALTVDHRLRPESAAEARTVASWMAKRGIGHVRLDWRRAPAENIGAGNIQARARAARYRLMADWCSAHGVLHLLLAHHSDDQAETLLLRLGRGSGVDGLAAMAPVSETYGVRLLRPLLALPRTRPEATLRRAGQPWIDDPSNRNTRFARVRIRSLAPALAGEGMTSDRLAATAARLRRARETLEDMTADFLVRAMTPFAEGYVILDRAALRAAPVEIARRALARIVAAVGGLAYVPRRESTEGLLIKLIAPSRPPRPGANESVLATLGGVMVVADSSPSLLFVREPSAVTERIAIAGSGAAVWDGRFRLQVRRRAVVRRQPLVIAALGEVHARRIAARMTTDSGRALAALPRRVRATLPALFDAADRPIQIAEFGFAGSYGRAGGAADSLDLGHQAFIARFSPPLPLVGPGSIAGFILV